MREFKVHSIEFYKRAREAQKKCNPPAEEYYYKRRAESRRTKNRDYWFEQ